MTIAIATVELTQAQRNVVFSSGTQYAGERALIRHQWVNGDTDVLRVADGRVYRRQHTTLDPYVGLDLL